MSEEQIRAQRREQERPDQTPVMYQSWQGLLFLLNGLEAPDRSVESVLAAKRVDVSIYSMERVKADF